MQSIRRRLTYSNVLATLAMFVALGGSSYAALKLPARSVGTKQLKKNAVTLVKIAPATRKRLRGRTGATGPQGVKGDKGDPGAQGPAAARSVAAKGQNPPASPNQTIFDTLNVAVPAAGNLLVQAQWKGLTNGCAGANTFNCAFAYGLYLDDVPITGTAHNIVVTKGTTDVSEWSFSGIVPVTPGDHVLKVAGSVTNGQAVSSQGGGSVGMQAVLVG